MPIVPVFDPDTGASGGPAAGGGGGGGTPAWTTVADIDFTGCDALAMTGAITKTFNLTKNGGTPFIDVVTSTNATDYDYSAGAGGITYNNMTGIGVSGVGIDLTSLFSKTGAAPLVWDDWQDPVAIQILVTGVTWGSTVHDLVCGISEQTANPSVTTLSFGWRGLTDGVDNDWKVRRYQGSAAEKQVITNQPYSSSYLLTIILHAGIITEQWVQAGATAVADDPRQGLGPYTAGFSSIANGDMAVALDNAFVPYMAVAKGGAGTDPVFTLTHLRVQRFEVAP